MKVNKKQKNNYSANQKKKLLKLDLMINDKISSINDQGDWSYSGIDLYPAHSAEVNASCELLIEAAAMNLMMDAAF